MNDRFISVRHFLKIKINVLVIIAGKYSQFVPDFNSGKMVRDLHAYLLCILCLHPFTMRRQTARRARVPMNHSG